MDKQIFRLIMLPEAIDFQVKQSKGTSSSRPDTRRTRARMGVQRAHVSKIESGRNLTFSTVERAFKALGIPAELSVGGMKVALW